MRATLFYLEALRWDKLFSATSVMMGLFSDAIIAPEYKHYIYENSKFVANSRINVNMGLNGIEIQEPHLKEWLEGGIHLIPGSQGAPKEQYRLYRNDFYAKTSIEGNELPVTLTLKAASLPGIQKVPWCFTTNSKLEKSSMYGL